MKAFGQIAYFLVGLVQFFAVWAGITYFLGIDSFIGNAFAFVLTLFVTYIPILGSAIGVYGATHVWDWSLMKSLVLFFWYVPLFLIFVIIPVIGGLFSKR